MQTLIASLEPECLRVAAEERPMSSVRSIASALAELGMLGRLNAFTPDGQFRLHLLLQRASADGKPVRRHDFFHLVSCLHHVSTCAVGYTGPELQVWAIAAEAKDASMIQRTLHGPVCTLICTLGPAGCARAHAPC